jgi:hypothetical protein
VTAARRDGRIRAGGIAPSTYRDKAIGQHGRTAVT